MLNPDNTTPEGEEAFNSIVLFSRADGSRTEKVITEALDIHQEAWQYLTENKIKVSADDGNPDDGILIYFDDGTGNEITVSTFKHPCEYVLDAGVALLKARRNA